VRAHADDPRLLAIAEAAPTPAARHRRGAADLLGAKAPRAWRATGFGAALAAAMVIGA
jgi:hypothetical protein